jgi:hypothetical protein
MIRRSHFGSDVLKGRTRSLTMIGIFEVEEKDWEPGEFESGTCTVAEKQIKRVYSTV